MLQQSVLQTDRQASKDPYRDYLANKTTLLPALAEMKQGIIQEKLEKVYQSQTGSSKPMPPQVYN